MTFSTTLLPVALRDTALTVAILADNAAPMSFETFRKTSNQQVAQLREQLTLAGQPRDVIDDAIYAQCALLDEAALGTLTSADRDAWETEPLQVGQFNSHDAGQELITRIERRLAEPQPVLPLLALFNTVLGLGFKGKFALHSGDARTTLMQAVDERLGRASERDTSGPVVVTRGRGRPWFKDLSPLGWVATTLVVGAFSYVGIDRWLTASLPLAN